MKRKITIDAGFFTVPDGVMWMIYSLRVGDRIIFSNRKRITMNFFAGADQSDGESYAVCGMDGECYFISPFPLGIPEGSIFQFVKTEFSLLSVEEIII